MVSVGGLQDPLDDKNVMLEIRAGTGGSEAGLFAGDLLDVYMRFAVRRRRRWVITTHG